eukprot:g23839.t1
MSSVLHTTLCVQTRQVEQKSSTPAAAAVGPQQTAAFFFPSPDNASQVPCKSEGARARDFDLSRTHEVAEAQKLLQLPDAQAALERCLRDPPPLRWKCFLSHVQAEALDACRLLSRCLKEKNVQAWDDKEAGRVDIVGVVEGVAGSSVFVVYGTKSYFQRPWCLFELAVARKLGKVIITIMETDQRMAPLSFGALSQYDKPLADQELVVVSRDYYDAFVDKVMGRVLLGDSKAQERRRNRPEMDPMSDSGRAQANYNHAAAKQEAAAQQRKQEQDKKLRREALDLFVLDDAALEEMQKEADMHGGLQYLHAHGMFVGKSGAGKSSVLEAMQNVPHEAKKGSTKGADLVEIQIAHFVSGGSGWRAVKPGEDTLTEQQRVMALNLAAKINERQQGGGKSVVVEQASLEDFQLSKVELQRQRKRPHIEESPLLEQDVPLVVSATASSVSGEDQKKLPSPRPTAPDPSTSATRTSPSTDTPSPSPSSSAAATFPSSSAIATSPSSSAAPTSSTSAALISSWNLKQTKQQTEVPKEGSHLMDGELLLGMVEDGKIKGDELSLSLWDMGGQDVFHSLHHLFLKRGALFLVLFDMRELVEGADPKQKQECLSHLRFWLRSLETHTFEEGNGWAPVFLVGTHKDFVTKESEHKHIAEVLDREFGGSSFYSTKKLYTPPNGRDFPFFPVDNKVRPVDPTVQALMKALEATARNEEYIKRKIPVPWVKLFDKLFQQAKKQSWLSREEVVQLATQCGLANPTNNIDLVLRYLHDQGRVLYFADQPSLRDLVILDPTHFFLEPVTRIICEFDTHRIPAHDEAIKSLSSAWTKLKSSGMLEKRLLPILWADRSEETREYLLALMIKFGLAVELQADASEAADEVVFLVPALLPKEPPSLKKPKSLEVSCSIGFYPREERAAAEPETIEERVKTVGFLPSGFFSRLLGKCFTWSQGWSAGVNWNNGWSENSTPAQLFQKRALLSFGALRFEITVFDDLNILRVRCGDENPRALLRRLLLLCEEVIEEALGGALLVRPYLEHEGTMVRLEKAQDAVRRGVKLLFDDKWLLPEQIKEKFSPHWFPPAQPLSKFDAFWCFREGPFDSALVGKLQDRLLDMGVPPFHMAQKVLRWEQILDALTRSRLMQAMDDVRVAEGTGESQEPAEVATAIAKQTESDAEAEFRGQIEQAAKQAETLLKDKKAQQQLKLSKDMRVEARYVAFLSHAQAQAGDVVRTIYLEMDRKCWYDKEQVERTLGGMIKGIAMSEVFLIYVSKAYFTRPYCRFELQVHPCLHKLAHCMLQPCRCHARMCAMGGWARTCGLLQVARLLEKPIVVVREASLRPTRGPIDLPQIEACDKQLVEFDILALSDELRDAFSTGFIPLLKARINTALGKEVLATATPASPTAATPPGASNNNTATQSRKHTLIHLYTTPQSFAMRQRPQAAKLKINEEVVVSFRANAVDGPMLLELTDEDLEKDLGVKTGLMRKKILANIKTLKYVDSDSCSAPSFAAEHVAGIFKKLLKLTQAQCCNIVDHVRRDIHGKVSSQ